MSKFGAEAESSYMFLQFEVENVLKMFLNGLLYFAKRNEKRNEIKNGIF